jgi:hypothetical protein
MTLIRKVLHSWSKRPEDVVHHIEDIEERHQDIQRDLYVTRQRVDTLKKLVAGMRNGADVH